MTAYLIATMDVHDPDTYADYRAQVPGHLERHGGRFIVRGGERTDLEGEWPDGRIVVIAFPDFAAAESFLADPGYRKTAEIRHKSATSHVWIVDGAPGASVEGLNSFLIADVQMHDPVRYRDYSDNTPAVVAAAGGVYVARGGQARSVEGGAALDRLVIVGFPGHGGAPAFHASPDYSPLIPVRQSASTGRVVAVEGLDA